jgi:hypothetical protein
VVRTLRPQGPRSKDDRGTLSYSRKFVSVRWVTEIFAVAQGAPATPGALGLFLSVQAVETAR